jgi:hypothetical protein
LALRDRRKCKTDQTVIGRSLFLDRRKTAPSHVRQPTRLTFLTCFDRQSPDVFLARNQLLCEGDESMSWLKLSAMLFSGALLVGLAASVAMSQETPPPRDSGNGWDNGPAPAGRAGSPREGREGPRHPQAQRDDGQTPPGRPQSRDDRDGNRQPPSDDNSRRPGPPPGEQGDRPAPPPGPEGPDANGPQPFHGPDGARPQPFGPPMDFEAIKTRDPELYKAMQEDRDLERQTRDQADQYRRASKEDQAKIKDKLAEIVTKHFAVRQQLRTLEVKRLEQQVKELRDRIDQREKNRKEIVGKRIAELTGTDENEHF